MDNKSYLGRHLRYKVLLASNAYDLKTLLKREGRKSRSMSLTVRQTRFMVISKRENTPAYFNVNNENVERVYHFKYMGCSLNDRWDHSHEIRCRRHQPEWPL